MKSFLAPASICLLMSASAATAAPVSNAAVERRMSPEYMRCAPAAMEDMARLTCILSELQMHDDALNAQIKAKAGTLGKSRRASFQKQQYSWFYARNRQCLRESRQGPTPVFAKELKCRLFETIRHRIALERAG